MTGRQTTIVALVFILSGVAAFVLAWYFRRRNRRRGTEAALRRIKTLPTPSESAITSESHRRTHQFPVRGPHLP